MEYRKDTIVAISTASGAGGIAIVRISGPEAAQVFRGAFRPEGRRRQASPISHMMTFGHVIYDGQPVDQAMGVLFKAPRSYTREDVAEIHCHGGQMAANLTLRACVALGARPALPGEFTYRAFVNGRVTLSQAEAVMDMISAEGEAAARAALRQMQGNLPRFIRDCRDRLTSMLAAIAAAVDFPDEIDEVTTAQQLLTDIRWLIGQLDRATDERAARVIREGLSVAIMGKPNVGKSSLLNALLGRERAIVSDTPGTTRDVVSERMMVEGVPVRISDTAGVRDAADTLESRGVQLALKEAGEADVVLVVIDASAPLTEEDIRLLKRRDAQSYVLLNKIDMPMSISVQDIARMAGKDEGELIPLSARTGQGISKLLGALADIVKNANLELALLTNQRHIARAIEARAHLHAAMNTIDQGMPLDLAAVEMMDAGAALGEISGLTAADEVINAVFERFCVGK